MRYRKQYGALKKVEIYIPLRFAPDGINVRRRSWPSPFYPVAAIISLLSNSVSTLTLEFGFVDRCERDRLLALEAVPWTPFDQRLTARSPQTELLIYIPADWSARGKDAAGMVIRSSMASVVARDKLRLRSKVFNLG